jgi:hypothetical protein
MFRRPSEATEKTLLMPKITLLIVMTTKITRGIHGNCSGKLMTIIDRKGKIIGNRTD